MLAGLAKLVAGLALWAAPDGAATLPAALLAEVERLDGHEVHIENGEYRIVDIAGEGAPLVGCVRKSERGLVLESGTERLLLGGPLAVPRIAGPDYKVWVLGPTGGGVMQAKRLGILAGPAACPSAN